MDSLRPSRCTLSSSEYPCSAISCSRSDQSQTRGARCTISVPGKRISTKLSTSIVTSAISIGRRVTRSLIITSSSFVVCSLLPRRPYQGAYHERPHDTNVFAGLKRAERVATIYRQSYLPSPCLRRLYQLLSFIHYRHIVVLWNALMEINFFIRIAEHPPKAYKTALIHIKNSCTRGAPPDMKGALLLPIWFLLRRDFQKNLSRT